MQIKIQYGIIYISSEVATNKFKFAEIISAEERRNKMGRKIVLKVRMRHIVFIMCVLLFAHLIKAVPHDIEYLSIRGQRTSLAISVATGRHDIGGLDEDYEKAQERLDAFQEENAYTNFLVEMDREGKTVMIVIVMFFQGFMIYWTGWTIVFAVIKSVKRRYAAVMRKLYRLAKEKTEESR